MSLLGLVLLSLLGLALGPLLAETADVMLARNDLMLVPVTLRIAQTSLRTIYQNFAASIGVNVVGLGFGAMGRLSPFAAAIVHNLSTIAVVFDRLTGSAEKMAESAADFMASARTRVKGEGGQGEGGGGGGHRH
ncbi:MAG: Lead, cadmium, zinc and mercury transporting ATPase [Myxococcales bacterium]|nr:Lead, cadmium, zinc and mercury transporting ATPase [Myxococcales bacterium]